MTDLMTVREAAAYFRVTENNIHKWAARGILSKLKIGGKTYFRTSDIQTLVRRPRMGRPRKAVQG